MTEKKSMTKKTVNANKPVGQQPVPVQAKIIGAVLLLAFVGCSIFWFVAKNKLASFEESFIKTYREKGFAIEKEPTTFSGFPFTVKGHIPKLKITRGDGKSMSVILQGEPVEVSIAPWRPSRITVTGPITYGAYASGVPVLALKVERIQTHINMGKDSKAEVHDMKLYDVGIIKGEGDKIASVAEFSVKSEEKADGDLTKLFLTLELENIDFAASAMPVVLEKISLEGAVASPYKTGDELASAVQSFNKGYNEDLKKRCDAKAECMPPLKVVLHAIEDSKSNFNFNMNLKGGDYGLSLKLEGLVKDAFPELLLTIDLKNIDKLLDFVVETGLLTPSMARASTLFLANVGNFDEKANQRRIEIRLAEKVLKMGDKILWEFKDFDFDEIKLPVAYCSYLDKADADKESKTEEAAGSLVGLNPAL